MPWPGHSGGVERARGRSSELPHHVPNLTHSRASGTRQKWEGFGAAEHSDEVGEIPASDYRLTDDSHIGRACAGAYCGEGEHGGGLGAENGSLARPAASGGARPATAPRRSLLLLWSRAGEGEGAGRGHNGVSGGAGWRPDRGKLVGRAAASTTSAYGYHVAGAGWREAGTSARAGEGRGGRASWLDGPKGRRVGPAAPGPFSIFFEFLFCTNFPNSF